MAEIRKRVPSHIAVQGNLNPEILKTSSDNIHQRVSELLQSMEGQPGFILGHGMSPDIPVAGVEQCKAVLHGLNSAPDMSCYS